MPRSRLPLLLVLALVQLAACRNGERRGDKTVPAPSQEAPPKLRLIALTDMGGYLEPCGCQSVPLGGIDKATAELDRLAADGAPALLVSVGDLFFEQAGGNQETTHDDPGAADATTQQRWQAETLAGVLRRMGLQAAVPGPADLNLGPAVLAALAKYSGAPLLAAGVEAPEGLELGSTRVVERGGIKVGLWGLSDFAPARGEPVLKAPADMIAEARRMTAALRAKGAQIVVGLLRADGRTARRLAGGVEGLDFLVHGGPDSPDFPPPERIGGATLLRGAHRGHGLLVVDLYPGKKPGAGSFRDDSVWTREARASALGREIDRLAERIVQWEKEGSDPKLVAEQKARLTGMKAEALALAKPVASGGSGGASDRNVFSARFIRLDPDVEGATTIRVLLEAHDKRVNEHNRVALAGVAPPPLKEGQAGYVGSEVCGRCHAPALIWWQEHPHGHAYETLESRNKQFNLSCVGCHVTGYNKPGGSTVVQNEGLTGVGCESCHGPGSKHVDNPQVPPAKNVSREVPESTCLQCHVPEHSDRFHYETYKKMLMAPGHGLPVKGGN